MENASKALVIAGTILITILIISVGIYVFAIFSAKAYEHEQERQSQALVAENMKFTKYEDKTLTSHDYITIVNMVIEYNKQYTDQKISLNGKELDQLKDEDRKNILEQTNKTYIMKITENYNSGRIKSITIN